MLYCQRARGCAGKDATVPRWSNSMAMRVAPTRTATHSTGCWCCITRPANGMAILAGADVSLLRHPPSAIRATSPLIRCHCGCTTSRRKSVAPGSGIASR